MKKHGIQTMYQDWDGTPKQSSALNVIEEIDRLRTFIAEKDREIEQLEAENDNMRKIFDGLMAILPPEYFVKEDGDDSTVEDFRQPSSGGD